MTIILAGALVGLGITLVLLWASPAHPDLPEALGRLDPAHHPRGTQTHPDELAGAPSVLPRLGIELQRRLPTRWARVPSSDLQVLQITPAEHLGRKAALAVAGLFFPSVLNVVAGLSGLALPAAIPLMAGPLLAAAMWMLPDLDVRQKAREARDEFGRAIAAYLDLTALERAAGGGSSQALEAAAEVGDSWVFRRVREEVARARFAGQPIWDALSTLGDELGVPALTDTGDLMRMGAEEGMSVVEPLRARAASLRDQHLSADHAQANAANEALSMPVTFLGVVFLALLTAPALLTIAFSS